MHNDHFDIEALIEFLQFKLKNSFLSDEIVSFNIVGSAANRKPVDEIDCYIVFKNTNHINLQYLTRLISSFDLRNGKTALVEFRRGPFKPNRDCDFQFHLIIDDLSTIEQTSMITLCDWHFNGLNIFGSAIKDIVPFKSDILKGSFKEELLKVGSQILHNAIFYKEWIFNEKPFLEEKKMHGLIFPQLAELYKYGYSAMNNNLSAYLKFCQKDTEGLNIDLLGLPRFIPIVKSKKWHLLDFNKFKSTVLEFDRQCFYSLEQ